MSVCYNSLCDSQASCVTLSACHSVLLFVCHNTLYGVQTVLHYLSVDLSISSVSLFQNTLYGGFMCHIVGLSVCLFVS